MTSQRIDLSSYKLCLGLLLFVVISLFYLWASFAPMSSAAIAQGYIRSSGFSKEIQHLGGGIVTKINVDEGQTVRKGDVLVQLKNDQPRLSIKSKLNQLLHLLLQRELLTAMLNKQEKLMVGLETLKLSEKLSQESRLFFNHSQLKKQRDIERELMALHNSQLHQIKLAIVGKKKEKQSYQDQLASLELERGTYEKLASSDFYARQKLQPINRNITIIMANITGIDTEIAQYQLENKQQQLSEINRKSQSDYQYQLQLFAITAQIPVITSELGQLKLTIDRSAIRATVAGKISNLSIHSVGGTIASQQVLMEIVPENDHLIVEVKLSPDDIDGIRLAAKTQVRLTAYNQRKMPMIAATVIQISPDRMFDSKGQPYYRVALQVNDIENMESLGLELRPGMGAEAFIETGKQTLTDYLFYSLFQGSERAFRDN